MYVHPEWAQRLHDVVRQHTTRNTDHQRVGLGQCVKEIRIGKFYEIDFCSKWSFCIDGTFDTWFVCRDVKKLLKTKQYFTGRNAYILNNP